MFYDIIKKNKEKNAMSFVESMIEYENQTHRVQNNIINHIKDSFLHNKNFSIWGQAEYKYLQVNTYEGTNKPLPLPTLGVFCSELIEVMMKYYNGQTVEPPKGQCLQEVFNKYRSLGLHQSVERACLAMNFFLGDPYKENYPFDNKIIVKRGEKDRFYTGGYLFCEDQSDNADNVTPKILKDPKMYWEDTFLHFYPFGFPNEKLTKRIYFNTTPEKATKIALALFKECAKHKDDTRYKPYIKFGTKDYRNDPMLAYCSEQNFELMLKLVHKIYKEHSEWFDGNCNLPLMYQIQNKNTGKCIIGIAEEPNIEKTSYNSLFTNAIQNFKEDCEKHMGKKASEFSPSELDALVTMKNFGPYLEQVGLSKDYPFLNKETLSRIKNKNYEQSKNQ